MNICIWKYWNLYIFCILTYMKKIFIVCQFRHYCYHLLQREFGELTKIDYPVFQRIPAYVPVVVEGILGVLSVPC